MSIFSRLLSRKKVVRAPTRRRNGLAAACAAVVEPLEARVLLSFSGSLSALPTATTGVNYVVEGTTTGTTSASSETFHYGDGTSSTVASPTNPQAATHAYSPPTTPYTYTPTASLTPSGGTAISEPLTLDSRFGSSPTYSGKELVNSYGNTSASNGGTAMTVDSAGNIYVVAPYDQTTTTAQFALTRFTSTGALDTTFNTTGTATISFDSGKDVPVAVAIDNSGNIVVAGNCSTGFAVARFLSTGSKDTYFGPNLNGTFSNFQSGTCTGMIVDTNDNIVLSGSTGSSGFVAVRVTNTGAVDATFGTSGVKAVSFPCSSSATATCIVQENFGSDDYILGGVSCNTSYNQTVFALAALSDGNGALDTTGFGSSGLVQTRFSSCSGASAVAYALVSDGTNDRIIAAGEASSGGGNAFGIAVYTSSGAPDTTFNSTGLKMVGIGTGAIAYGVDLQSDGQIVAAGYATGAGGFTGTGNDFAVVRMSGSSGALDSNFGSSGIAVTDFAAGSDTAYGVKFDYNDNEIVAGGNGGGKMAIARYLADNYVTVNAAGGFAPGLATRKNAVATNPLAATAVAPTLANNAVAVDPLDSLDPTAATGAGDILSAALGR